MDLFAQQKDVYLIARRLNSSEKTAGAYKINVLKNWDNIISTHVRFYVITHYSETEYEDSIFEITAPPHSIMANGSPY